MDNIFENFLFIIMFFILYILYKQQSINTDQFTLLDENSKNFIMDDNSILLNNTTRYTLDECLLKPNKKDIVGASFNKLTNECKLYSIAKKGIKNINHESIILI
jgi:hypothetical protein